MLKIKNEKGITLVILILTMILLVIIAVISINYAYDGITYSTERRLLTEVEEVQQAVMEKYTEFRQLDIDENEDSYLNVASDISVDELEKYSDNLKHMYSSSNDVDPSKRYYTLSETQLENLDLEMRTSIDVNDEYMIKDTYGDYVLYIVNFYYGEVLNVYYSADFKTAHSGQLLYSIGRTTETDTTSILGELTWGDSIELPEKDGIVMTVDTSYSTYYDRGTISIRMANVSNTTRIVSDIALLFEDHVNSADMRNNSTINSYYNLDSRDNVLNISLSNMGESNFDGIRSGDSETISFYVYFDEDQDGNITILNYEMK